MTLPSLFLSHGAPTLPLTDTSARDFLKQIGGEIRRPEAILVASAHWETVQPTVNAVESNETIHDFYGFPRPLYDLRYAAPGSVELAGRVAMLLQAGGFTCATDRRRGLDHGAWVPLLLMYPRADIPVLQLSIQPQAGPGHHLRLGRALAPLRSDGVLIIGSGSFTHDLSEYRGRDLHDQAPVWVDSFADWFDQRLTGARIDELLAYRRLAPFASKNHPTEDHLLPLYVAMGAAVAGDDRVRVERLHASSTYGVLRMDVYAFSSVCDEQWAHAS